MGNPEGIKAGLNAMRSDAKLWQTSAESLKQPKETLGSLELTAQETSFFAEQSGLNKDFEELRVAVDNMIGQAMEYFTQISKDLTEAAQQYQDDDDKGKNELEKSQN